MGDIGSGRIALVAPAVVAHIGEEYGAEALIHHLTAEVAGIFAHTLKHHREIKAVGVAAESQTVGYARKEARIAYRSDILLVDDAIVVEVFVDKVTAFGLYAGICEAALSYLLVGVIETGAVETEFRIDGAVNQITELLADAETFGAVGIGVVVAEENLIRIDDGVLGIGEVAGEEEIEVAVDRIIVARGDFITGILDLSEV